jgi:hypothetical protein
VIARALGQRASARARLANSPLLRAGGAVITRLVGAGALRRLEQEAHEVGRRAIDLSRRPWLAQDAARGDPDRWLESAPGGANLLELYHSPALVRSLAHLTGLSWRPSGPLGSFSYYRREGHHLGLHLDVDECDVAVITCIADAGAPPRSVSGVLRLHVDRANEPLELIRSGGGAGAVDLRLAAGETLILLGGIVPHELLPVAAGHQRVVVPLCFAAV